jgi:LytS/YehU family sensor histidine kinase
MAHQAQLRMLRYQINPHFLFNTLNAISTLIFESRREEADEVVDALARFMRYSLHSNPQQLVKLDQEIEALMLYLAIEQARFGTRLRLTCNVAPQTRDLLVPSLILQPLVENAVKYAIAPREEGGTIEFSAEIVAHNLRMVLCDDGPGSDDYAAIGIGRGIGIANTRERLRVLCGEHQQFTIGRRRPSGTRVCIQIPIEHAQGEISHAHTNIDR